jgi:hypothetical protein
MYFLAFCSASCGAQLHKELDVDGYMDLKHIILVPLSINLIVKEDEIKEDLQKRAMALPMLYSGTVCDHCTARHMTGTPKFKMCSACEAVRYCSKECQIEHWKSGGHRAKCGKPLEKSAPLLKVPVNDEEMKQYRTYELVEETTHSDCFDAVDMARRRAARACTCSWHKCNRKIEGHIPLSFAINTCRVGGGLHVTPTAYCCTGHRNRDHVGCIGSNADSKKEKERKKY